MSVKMMAAVWELNDVSATEKLVLLKFADCADDFGGNAYPAIHTVAADCSLSERAVQGIVRRLEEQGRLHVEREHDRSRHRPTTYRVVPSPGAGDAPGKETARVQMSAAPGADGGPSSAPDPSDPKEIHPEDDLKNAHARGKPSLTDEERKRLHERFDGEFGADGVDERVREALGHKASLKWIDVFAGVNGWLRRDSKGNGNGTSAGRGDVASGGGYARNGGGAVGSVREGGDSVVRGAFPVARQWPPAGNQ